MGSTRLPGKMMLSLGCKETITRVIERVTDTETIDGVVVATTMKKPDSLLADWARHAGASVYRGSESDVLQRMVNAAAQYEADIIVRIAGDCPAVSPVIIDHAVSIFKQKDTDYVSNKLERTFPLGLDVEVFTMDSFAHVENVANQPKEREHVTVYYQEHPDEFSLHNFSSTELFDRKQYQDRTDIELVLDEPEDYILLNTIFSDLQSGDQDVSSIIEYVDTHNLSCQTEGVKRKTKEDTENGVE
jgi:spore coat polysaccharide biosynthesis protein SpsF